MTTYQVPEDQALADALTVVIERLGTDRQAVRAVCELRSAAAPGNGFRVASVPWGPVRARIALALRQVAADGHPLAGQLQGMAAGLSPGTVPQDAAGPGPEPAAEPVPVPALPPAPAAAPEPVPAVPVP